MIAMNSVQIESDLSGNVYCGAVRQNLVTPSQLSDLTDKQKQQQYGEAYRLQQARLICPGCGEDCIPY